MTIDVSGKTGLIGQEILRQAPTAKGDFVFLALPPERAIQVAPHFLRNGIRVIDMSGAFRLTEVYGIPELFAKEITSARIVANPGCYALGIIQALLPYYQQIKGKIRIVAISGFSGGGKHACSPKRLTAYKPGRQHQHIAEIEKTLGLPGQIYFYPIVAPWARGITMEISFLTEAGRMVIRNKLDNITDVVKNAIRVLAIMDKACSGREGG